MEKWDSYGSESEDRIRPVALNLRKRMHSVQSRIAKKCRANRKAARTTWGRSSRPNVVPSFGFLESGSMPRSVDKNQKPKATATLELSDSDSIVRGNGVASKKIHSSLSSKVIDLTGQASIDEQGEQESQSQTSVSFGDRREADVTETTWRIWVRHLEISKPWIFDSDEARLRIRSKTRRGVSAYDGIGVTSANCQGLRHVLNYANDMGLRSSGKKTKKLCTTVSQFLRWCVASGSCSKYEVWAGKSLFRSITKLRLVEPFICYFRERCSNRTANEKVQGLLMMCKVARLHLERGLHADLDRVTTILESIIGGRKQRRTL